MPKVRIVDPKSGFRMSLPVPYRLFINLFVRRSIVLNVLHGRIKSLMDELVRCPEGDEPLRNQIERDIRLYNTLSSIADGLDFREIRAALRDIHEYRGLVLVDVRAVDGTIVHITL